MDGRPRARAGARRGLLPAGAPVVVLLSGRARLRLPARRRGAAGRRRRGRRAARQLRPARRGRRRRAPLRGAVRAARRRAGDRAPAPARRAPATCRRGRATCATPPPRSARSRAAAPRRRRPHRRRPGRDDPLPARLLAEPPRAARHAPARRAARAAAARRHARGDDRLLRASAGSPGATTRRNAGDAYARNRVRNGARAGAARQIHPAAAANVLRTAALLRDEAEVLDALVDRAARRARRPARRSRSSGSRRCRRRCAGSSCSGSPTTPPGRLVPGAARRADEVAALRRTGTRDARPRRRRARGRRARACCAPSAAATAA